MLDTFQTEFSMTDLMQPETAAVGRDSPLSATRPADRLAPAFEKSYGEFPDKELTEHMSTKVISLNNVLN